MAKVLFKLSVTVILTLCVSVTVFAHHGRMRAVGYGYGHGYCAGVHGAMWDENGDFLERDAFEEVIDKAIEDGYAAEEDKAFYLERYDYCASFGGGAIGYRGGCGGYFRR